MITRAQRLAVEAANPAALPTLDAMWEQRRRWWMASAPDAEARAAATATKLHMELLDMTGLPDLLVSRWEREWDEKFEVELRGWWGASRGR